MKIILGTPINSRPKPWLYFKINSLMVNAFDILKNRRYLNNSSLRMILNFDNEIWIDSGGYQFLKHGIEPKIEDIERIYEKYWDARFYLNLDYPPSPSDDEYTLKIKLRKSLENYDRLFKKFENTIPIIHFHHKIDIIMNFLKKYLNYNFEILAVGALVPYVLMTKGVPSGSRRLAINFLKELRSIFKGKIHVLGLGSPIVTAILKAIGIDSTDSSTWRVKAAYGKIVSPGGGEVHVTDRNINFGKKKASIQDINRIYNFLRETNFPLIGDFWKICTDFEYRALVNAWIVIHSEELPRCRSFLKIYREAISARGR